MTDDMIKLGKRAVACKGFRWLPGMLAVEWAAPGMGLTGGRPVRVDERWHEVGVWLPDLTDPATLGCLLALVREAWGDHYAFVGWFDPHWKVIRCRTESLIGCLAGRGDTEPEALVAALDVAP